MVPTTLMSDRVLALVSGDAMDLKEDEMLFYDAEMPWHTSQPVPIVMIMKNPVVMKKQQMYHQTRK